MQHSFLPLLFLNPTQRDIPPVAGFYLFVVVSFIFILVKLSGENYWKKLVVSASFDQNKFDSLTSIFQLSKNSFFLQIATFVIFSLGFSVLSYHYTGDYQLAKITLGVFVFYLIQAIGFVAFSSIISNSNTFFVKHRLSYNELIGVFVFPIILISFYSHYNLSLLILVVMLSSLILIMTRVSVYLTSVISVFHIILYLCTLEIIPILFLLKFIFN